ncbi:hypothetical protein ES332_A10G192600v1 [Gossypium tomentosum]|uniref:Uncharacterized protein n=1 Tax=Gossypium tomentosum TaxID=34277 RepID=A0A5D2NRX3_GOSTO|nr:hypothetical protein ES332_A10G192600v1 [Gossypium tomentosum]
MINNHGRMICMRKLKSQKKGIERLKTEIQDLKEVLGNVLTLLKTKFPDDNVNVLTVMRAFNREVFDASSGLNLSQRPRN